MSTPDLLAPYRSQKKQIARYLINHPDTTITMDRLADSIGIEPSGAWITTRALLLKEPRLPGLMLVSGNGTAAKVRWSDPTPAHLPTPATNPSETNGSTPVPAPVPAASVMFDLLSSKLRDLLREIIAETKTTNELLLEIATKPGTPTVEVHNAAPTGPDPQWLARHNSAPTPAAPTPAPTGTVEDSDLPVTATTPFTPLSPTSPNESITITRGRPCMTCTHPRRRVIEAYIREAKDTLVSIGQIFGVPAESLGKHRSKHMGMVLRSDLTGTTAP